MNFSNFIKLMKLFNSIRKLNIFDLTNHFGFLDLISAFLTIKSAAPEQYSSMVLSRTFSSSTKLLLCLIEKYKLTKSEVILNQITEVIKEEIIKRGV